MGDKVTNQHAGLWCDAVMSEIRLEDGSACFVNAGNKGLTGN